MNSKQRAHLTCVQIILLIGVNVANAQLFQDQMNSSTGWAANANNADNAAIFGYDYSADGIPEAPNSQIGDDATTGLKMEANIADGAISVITVYPVGQSFSGDYQLRFDVWMNYDITTFSATTEFVGGTVGYDDTSSDIGIGAEILLDGDGGSSNDWRAFAEGVFLSDAEMVAGDHNGSDPHYANFLPGVAPPLSQSQAAGTGIPGSPGFQWITVEINTLGGVANIWIEKPGGQRLHIARFNHDAARPYTNDGNIAIRYADYFTSVTTQPSLTFGVIDNVEVYNTPVPVTLQRLSVE